MDDPVYQKPDGSLAACCLERELTAEEKEDIYFRALPRARRRMVLYVHAVVFTGVMVLLLLTNLLTTPRTLWVVWPFLGWGVGLVLHWLGVAKLDGAYDKVYERVRIEEIARELERQGRARAGM